MIATRIALPQFEQRGRIFCLGFREQMSTWNRTRLNSWSLRYDAGLNPRTVIHWTGLIRIFLRFLLLEFSNTFQCCQGRSTSCSKAKRRRIWLPSPFCKGIPTLCLWCAFNSQIWLTRWIGGEINLHAKFASGTQWYRSLDTWSLLVFDFSPFPFCFSSINDRIEQIN